MVAKEIMIVAGEPSADLHGSKLVRRLKELDPDVKVFGAGGPLMVEAGLELTIDLMGHATVGMVDPLILWRIYRNATILAREARRRRPDAIVYMDMPDFNLPLSKACRPYTKNNIYYISPQIWAWRAGRIKQIKKRIDKVLCLFAFEEGWYRKRGYNNAKFIGHPLLDEIEKVKTELPTKEEFRNQLNLKEDDFIIGLLPGSRCAEVARFLPIYKEALKTIQEKRPNIHLVMGQAPHLRYDLQDKFSDLLSDMKNLHVVKGETYNVMRSSDFLFCKSGTTTLEAALFKTPMIICYKIGDIAGNIARTFVRFQMVGAANIVADKWVVPELIQHNFTAKNLSNLFFSMEKCGRIEKMRQSLNIVEKNAGGAGATDRAAKEILQSIGE